MLDDEKAQGTIQKVIHPEFILYLAEDGCVDFVKRTLLDYSYSGMLRRLKGIV